MKTLAYVFALCIAAFGLVGVVAPSGLVWVAHQSVTPSVFCVVGTVRVAFGLVLLSVASSSRSPRALRVMGCLIVVAGISAVLAGLFGIERARDIVEWWTQLGSVLLRLTAAFLVALGGFVAYACAPSRRVP